MANVCVITGGGSGMGLETARNIDKDVILVLTGRTISKLENAKKQLEAEGHKVFLTACDVSVRRDVHELCLFADSLGTIKTVIHAAGLSPTMADPEKIIMVNAVGTKNVNMEFYKYMNDGGVIVDVASSSAYEAPGILIKHQIYEEAEYKEEAFIRHMTGEANLAPDDYNKCGMAYVLSKNFVVWYAQKCAHEYARKGIRVVSVSPGLIETDMGTQEVEKSEFAKQMIERTCEHRMGKAEELGFAIATIADERNGYLSGIDVLIDGGASTGKKA
ncbi:MAG: SDR family NAD(P)-dependent oxidoreductase [Eubacteriales bacterium]|nr:SDR family NAD(P)-dependent oxidoreductase [Eubacteriales bacterium]